MEIIDKNSIVVEIDKKVAISFNKKYKDFVGEDGEHYSLDLKEVKKEITEYLLYHRHQYKGHKVFSFVYDYDTNIAVTVMKRAPEFEIYDVIGFADMTSSEETIEDDEEAAATKEQIKILKNNEKIQKAREQGSAKHLEEIFEKLGG